MLMDFTDTCVKIICYCIARPFGGYRLKPYEKQILLLLLDNMPATASAVFKDQLNYYNYFSHWVRKQEVLFLKLNLGFKDLPDSAKMPFREIGTFPVICAKPKSAIKTGLPTARVDILVDNGEFREMIFDLPPRKVFGRRFISEDEISLFDIKLLFDPMNPNPFPTLPFNDASRLPKWLSTSIDPTTISEMYTPLSEEIRLRIVDYYDLQFPDDYLELVSTTEYIDSDDFEIFGLSKIWIYLTPDEYVLKVVEIKGHGALCLLRGQEPGLYYIDNEDHIPVPIGNSLKEAIHKAAHEGVQDWKDMESDYVPRIWPFSRRRSTK